MPMFCCTRIFGWIVISSIAGATLGFGLTAVFAVTGSGSDTASTTRASAIDAETIDIKRVGKTDCMVVVDVVAVVLAKEFMTESANQTYHTLVGYFSTTCVTNSTFKEGACVDVSGKGMEGSGAATHRSHKTEV
ncbi:hypothetical protein ElyMa_004405500 [Elysia marginata]|uniref:Uncharacterized protein n=1 Tax=Elysia marginata TaxID=1093978 RepID=A0AAV4HBW3_9GAST|nr:hypothetical protein ElyMa_004405500 [Elysia marginata]